jgi:hypothetical protein
MLRQRYELRMGCTLSHAFSALLDVVARGRWGAAAIVLGTTQPRVGMTYAQQRRSVFRRGRVTECLRPVALTLTETLLDPPCCVELRLHWRLEPCDSGAIVLLEARFSLNGAASLRRRRWRNNVRGHCERMLAALERHSLQVAANTLSRDEKREMHASTTGTRGYTRDDGAAIAVSQGNADPNG